MNKILSVIIPYYKEGEKDILPLLSSLNNQLGVDYSQIECILVNDGNHNVLSESFLTMFHNLEIRIIYMEENRGPGIARQTGIDNANGEYMMFCDADDIIHSVGVIGAFMQEIEESHPDIITSQWIEELYDYKQGKFIYYNHEDEITWMHGKVFRRIFIQTRNIRFHDYLRVHEDSYFLAIAFASTNNAKKILVTTYVWKWGNDSITRRNNALYTFDSSTEFIKAIGLSFGEVERINPSQMQYKVIQFIMYQYFTTHEPHWQEPEKAEYLKRSEEALRNLLKGYIKYFENATMEYINEVYLQERAKHSHTIENELFHNWLNRILYLNELLETSA